MTTDETIDQQPELPFTEARESDLALVSLALGGLPAADDNDTASPASADQPHHDRLGQRADDVPAQ